MVERRSNVWGLHASRVGETDALFCEKKLVGIGGRELGSLGGLRPRREAFEARIAECSPGRSATTVCLEANQLFQFVHEIKPGDLVVYPSRVDRLIHIGRIDGGYRFDPDHEPDSPHLRPITWFCSHPRTRFTQGALYELGTTQSLFPIRNYADEFRSALENRPASPPAALDESTTRVAEEVEETTRDFVLKRLSQELRDRQLAEFVAHLLDTLGYRSRVLHDAHEGSVDLIAHKDELGIEPPVLKVQVRGAEGRVGEPVVSAFYGKVDQGENGLMVTLGTFTGQARRFARGKSNLRLIGGNELVELVLHHYEQLEARYQGLLPLRRIYIPQPWRPEG